MNQKPLSIYIHIPFCIKKCAYCDFLSFTADEEIRQTYLNALRREMTDFAKKYDNRKPLETKKEGKLQDYKVVSVYIGGGTPSVLNAAQITGLIELIKKTFDVLPSAEITIEANPGTVSDEKLAAYRHAGINRISFGLQSANDEELRILGRIHTYAQFLDSYGMARSAGFENINIDLMSALPGQTLLSWKETLTGVVKLSPEHISAYSLIIEEGTPFYELYHEQDERRSRGESAAGCKVPAKDQDFRQYGENAACMCGSSGCLYLPDEETERKIYHWTGAYLRKCGYSRYEISNYARPGRECSHNIGYWQRREYVGFGLGAASLLDEVRYTNTKDLNRYLQEGRDVQEQEILTGQDKTEELMFLGLRLTEGVNKEVFLKETGCSINQIYSKELAFLKANKLAEETKTHVRLSEFGLDISNYCMAQFIK